jgi:alpha,alpha-trehalose phosphorylase
MLPREGDTGTLPPLYPDVPTVTTEIPTREYSEI